MSLHATALLQDLATPVSILNLKSQEADPDLERLINALTYTFEVEASRPFRKRTLADYRVDGNGKRMLMLPFVPVQSVSKIEIRYNYNDSTYRTLTDRFVLKDGQVGQLQLTDDFFLVGDKNVLITMVVGYNDDDIEIATAVDLLLMQLKSSYRQLKNNEIGLVSRSYGDGSVSFFPPNRLLKEVRDGLSVLKDWRF